MNKHEASVQWHGRGNSEVLRKKTQSQYLCPPQILRGPA